ncbi:MAG: hypothetical protein NTZ87_03595 [Candidatus Nomurabacteria bacterium]|nr:hypothetical protein [Candidatus Nomurabacteria bacterium]
MKPNWHIIGQKNTANGHPAPTGHVGANAKANIADFVGLGYTAAKMNVAGANSTV